MKHTVGERLMGLGFLGAISMITVAGFLHSIWAGLAGCCVFLVLVGIVLDAEGV